MAPPGGGAPEWSGLRPHGERRQCHGRDHRLVLAQAVRLHLLRRAAVAVETVGQSVRDSDHAALV
jgi:hypothetical protein